MPVLALPVFVSSELAGFLFFPNSDGLRRRGAFGRPGDEEGGRAALGFWRRGGGRPMAGAVRGFDLCVVAAGALRKKLSHCCFVLEEREKNE